MSKNERSRDESNENNPRENMKSLPLKQNKPVRIKTKQFNDVKLPTYEESQAKYEKFLCTLKKADEKQKQNE